MQECTSAVQKKVNKFQKKYSKLRMRLIDDLSDMSRRQKTAINNCDKTIMQVQEARDAAQALRIEADNAIQEVLGGK